MIKRLYYYLKPIIPRRFQILLRRKYAFWKRLSHQNSWPIDQKAGISPVGWSGWPEKKRFALVLTHDVESEKGLENCFNLAQLEEELGFRSSFYFVPERYLISNELQSYLRNNGFEVGVHGLLHDGKLFSSKKVFQTRAKKINRYLQEWGSVGFRSPAMRCNLDWIYELDIQYDASTFDTDPFEPEPFGTRMIFPFWVGDKTYHRGYLELPYTLPQDFTLFVILKEKTIDIWRKKLDWIAQNGGMALLITHPDYMNMSGEKVSYDEYPVQYYKEFLEYIKKEYKAQYWNVLCRDIALFYRKRYRRKIYNSKKKREERLNPEIV